MIIRLVSVKEIQERLEPLILAHWQEVSIHKDKIPLLPMWEQYYKLDNSGKLILIAVEDGENLIGYSSYILHSLQHYASTIMASNDAIYIKPEYRMGMLASKIIRFGEEEATRRGATIASMHVKIEHDFSPLLTRLGYKNTEAVYTKLLGQS